MTKDTSIPAELHEIELNDANGGISGFDVSIVGRPRHQGAKGILLAGDGNDFLEGGSGTDTVLLGDRGNDR